MEHERKRDRLRSFLIGGALGASAALAAARSRARRQKRITPVGLAAFEDAPCFYETLANESDRGDGATARPRSGRL